MHRNRTIIFSCGAEELGQKGGWGRRQVDKTEKRVLPRSSLLLLLSSSFLLKLLFSSAFWDMTLQASSGLSVQAALPEAYSPSSDSMDVEVCVLPSVFRWWPSTPSHWVILASQGAVSADNCHSEPHLCPSLSS